MAQNEGLNENSFDTEIREVVSQILTNSEGTDLRFMEHKNKIQKIKEIKIKYGVPLLSEFD